MGCGLDGGLDCDGRWFWAEVAAVQMQGREGMQVAVVIEGTAASTLAVLWSLRRHDGDGLSAGDRLNRRGGSRLCLGDGAENWRWRQWIHGGAAWLRR
ncbi:hypothetical protein M0R45_019786 [Rubus argutus]|uniref:Uncharacterized protein n=1 Tax=Rubus argutus TaxID=59490 RepID=A0AAW1X871_RUBAR